jgi:hypothetical protein
VCVESVAVGGKAVNVGPLPRPDFRKDIEGFMSDSSGSNWFIGVALVGLALLVGPAGAVGLTGGPVLAMPSGTPEKVARALRYEWASPEYAVVTSKAVNDDGLRKYTITCPIRAGVDRGKNYTIITNSHLLPDEFKRRLYGTD